VLLLQVPHAGSEPAAAGVVARLAAGTRSVIC
jgi:hypothetical protein